MQLLFECQQALVRVEGRLYFVQERARLDAEPLHETRQEPELMDGNHGWIWRVGPEQEIRIEFGEPVHRVYFERGRTNQIRTMFFGSQVAAGEHSFEMTVTLPEGARESIPLSERYEPVDRDQWFEGALNHNESPVDLSFLNHTPAGRHGRLTVEGDRFVFEDGTPVRFWAGNIAASAIFSDRDEIQRHARRIARLGYNMMRIHHHDSMRWVSRTVIDRTRDDSRHFDEEVLERLDWWIHCLKEEGVYVWLDLHVGRLVKEGDEIGEGFAEMMRNHGTPQGANIKGFCYFNERIEELMREFNEKYLNRVNEHTGLAYKEDPAIIAVQLTNENDITNKFGNRMLGDKDNPYHHEKFMEDVGRFAEEHGLNRSRTAQTWLPGPSKIYLGDREARWNMRMIEHLRSMDVELPVCTTQMWGGNKLHGLPPLTVGDFIDVHSYGGAEQLGRNPRYQDTFVHYPIVGAAYGKPVSISEWNVNWPRVDRFTAPLFMASIASLQDWDAPMLYNYSQQRVGQQSRKHEWSTFTDPALTGVMPAAALIYRRADVRPAENVYMVALKRDNLFMENNCTRNMATLRTLAEQSRVTIGLPETPELDWLEVPEPAEGVQIVEETERDFIPEGQNYVESDTGQLRRYWEEGGYQWINAGGSQAVHGWIGGKVLETEDVRFEIRTPNAVAAVSALDDAVVGESRNILITTIARAVSAGGNRMPLYSEPVRGTLSIRAPEGLRLVPLAGDGEHLAAVDAPYADGRYTVELPVDGGTHWFLLTE